MDVLLITTGLAAIGYAYNTYQYCGSDILVKVSEHLKPRSELIYDSNRVNKVNEQVKTLAAKKYTQFLATQPKSQTRLPPGIPVNAPAYRPKDATPVEPVVDVQNTPMFRKFKPVPSDLLRIEAPFTRRAQPQAQPQPFFGGRVKQPGVDNRNSQALLERFTGSSSAGPRQETEAVLNGKTQKLAALDHMEEIQSRIWSKSGGDIAENPFLQNRPMHDVRFLVV
ncbi:hypothetical protein HK102_010612 [Quaeritorhiza haematococci]|nr:hypothetical protein HK102_010612 [Quaeritorhiza haematococci]